MELDFRAVLFCSQQDVDTLSQTYNVRSVTRVDNEDDSDQNESENEEFEDNEEGDTDEAMEDEEQGSGDEEEQEIFPYQHRANVEGYQRCDKEGGCNAQPCVTNKELNHQKWWIDTPEEKSEANSGKRKWKYRQFYSSIRSMGLWKVEKYLLKKTRLMLLDGITPGMSSREVMPDCVTAFVRSWLPNPDGKPYV